MSEKSISYKPIILILLPLVILSAIFFIPNSNGYLELSFFSSCQLPAQPPPPPPDSKPEFKLLFSILTVPEKTERRHIIRMAYALQKPTIPNVQIDVRFVFCKLKTDEQKVFIAMEILTYNDIIIMNCTENMDEGKTYTYFSSVPKMFPDEERPYDFVMKADDDAYFRLDKLYEALRDKPREDTYWGKGYPPLDQDNPPYFVGMGYALSWDLVQYIAESEFARDHTHGLEDINLAVWLGVGGKGKKRFNMRGKMYDFHGIEAKDFPNDTIAVHVLKNDFTWMVTLKNFNVTGGLEPSPLYHI
ncbi:beta-1,3-galactosyltransferase pvg3-like [Carex rostrata]